MEESCTELVPSATPAPAGPSLDEPLAGWWGKTKVGRGEVPDGAKCWQLMGHTTGEGKGITYKTLNRSTKSHTVLPEPGASESRVGRRLAATGNEGGRSREAAGGWGQGRKVE